MTEKEPYPQFEVMKGKTDTSKIEFKKWNDQTLENELFPSESEALSLIKENKITRFFNDRFIMGCLLSRKMDIDRTLKMLKSNLKWRLANGYEKIPEWESIDKALLKSNFASMIPGSRSKDGNAIIYCKIGQFHPQELGKDYVKTIVDYIIWNYSVGTFMNGIDYHRNGILFVTDMEGVGWKNMDIALIRKISGALMDNFPLKIKKILLINPPSILSTLLSVVRLFMKKKLLDRVEVIRREDLSNYIEEDQLWSEMEGGKCEYHAEDLIESIGDWSPTKKIRTYNIVKKDKKKKSGIGKRHKDITKKVIIDESTPPEEDDSQKIKSPKNNDESSQEASNE